MPISRFRLIAGGCWPAPRCRHGSGRRGRPLGLAVAHGTAAAQAVSQAEIDKAMATPTTLTFWTWAPDIEHEVALFEKKFPAIKANVVNAGQGSDHYTKLRTALKAGKGTPDLAQVEFQYIPTSSITGSLVDLRPYGAAANQAKFVDWTWGQVTGPNGEILAYPQDRPMACCTALTCSRSTASSAPDVGRVRGRGAQAARGRIRGRAAHTRAESSSSGLSGGGGSTCPRRHPAGTVDATMILHP